MLQANVPSEMNGYDFQSPFDMAFDYSSLLGHVQSNPSRQSLPLVSALSADFMNDLQALQNLEQPLEASGTVAALSNPQSLETAPILPLPEIYPAQP